MASFLLLTLSVNPLAACLALRGFLGYVFVYTLWLKRSTPQNIVIGGAAGAVPPLVGVGGRDGLAVVERASICSRSSSTGRRRTSGRCRY